MIQDQQGHFEGKKREGSVQNLIHNQSSILWLNPKQRKNLAKRIKNKEVVKEARLAAIMIQILSQNNVSYTLMMIKTLNAVCRSLSNASTTFQKAILLMLN